MKQQTKDYYKKNRCFIGYVDAEFQRTILKAVRLEWTQRWKRSRRGTRRSSWKRKI